MADFIFQTELDAIRTWIENQGQPTVRFGQAKPEALAWLAAQGVPQSVRQFYETAEPDKAIDSEGVYLIPIAKMIDENTNVVPGVVASKYGYIVIAQTISGDAYCVNTHCQDEDGQPPICLVSHDRLGSEATLNELRSNNRVVTQSFHQFLQRFAAGTLPYDIHFVGDG
jgi:hypothetical protein